jgi:hypothetical protein
MIRRQPWVSMDRNMLPNKMGNRDGAAAGGCLDTKAPVCVLAYRHSNLASKALPSRPRVPSAAALLPQPGLCAG